MLNKGDMNNQFFDSLNENTRLWTDNEIIVEVSVDKNPTENYQNVIPQSGAINNKVINALNTVLT